MLILCNYCGYMTIKIIIIENNNFHNDNQLKFKIWVKKKNISWSIFQKYPKYKRPIFC